MRMPNKTTYILIILIIIAGCGSDKQEATMGNPPDEPESFPKLTERNRLLGDLLPERTCYDVKHYKINMDIDVDNKYIKGFVDINASAVENFTTLQFDLAKKMKLNSVYYLDQKLNTKRKNDCHQTEKSRRRCGNGQQRNFENFSLLGQNQIVNGSLALDPCRL